MRDEINGTHDTLEKKREIRRIFFPLKSKLRSCVRLRPKLKNEELIRIELCSDLFSINKRSIFSIILFQ